MTHLTPDEMIDAIEGALAPQRPAHLATCEECRRQFDDLSGILSEAKRSTVPEPTPLYWPQFSRRVNEAIDASSPSAGSHWLRWQLLLPLGAIAMLLFALTMAVPKQARVESANAASVAPVAAEDTWASFADLVGDLDIDLAADAGVIEPGVADEALMHLTADEQLELSRLLQAELSRAKS